MTLEHPAEYIARKHNPCGPYHSLSGTLGTRKGIEEPKVEVGGTTVEVVKRAEEAQMEGMEGAEGSMEMQPQSCSWQSCIRHSIA